MVDAARSKQARMGRTYRARAAGCWWTDIAIRRTWSRNYRYRVLYDTRCH